MGSLTMEKVESQLPSRPRDEGSYEVSILDRPCYACRRLRVVCIGAGISGLTLAYHVSHDTGVSEFVDLAIYEKNAGIGGTWYENRYPGVACDIPAHIYSFPFEPNPNWSTFYASGSEILAYIEDTASKYRLNDYIKLQSKVTKATWDGNAGKWQLEIEQNGRIFTDACDILINGSGFLNKWRWPDIEGLSDFKGHLLHTANWDESINLSGNRIAVIGNGSSSIQAVPQLRKVASQLTNYIRSPTYISTNFAAEFTKDGSNFAFTEDEKQRFRDDPESFRAYRKELEHSSNLGYDVYMKNTKAQEAAKKNITQIMRHRLGNDTELCEKLIPSWELGCRRLTPGDGYLEALRESNACASFAPIIRVTSSGIETTEGHSEFDAIVCGTGFDVSFRPGWTMQGRKGISLNLESTDSPRAYFGLTTANAPNYFTYMGPNSPVARGSITRSISSATEWILKWCHKIAHEDIRSVCVKQQAIDDHNNFTQEFMKRTVWSGGCRSWYKNNKVDGPITGLYAGNALHYRAIVEIEVLESFRVEDFDIEYRSSNRFSFLGNGTTQRETRNGDLAFFVT